MIKNLVLSACGPNLVTMLGVLHELHEQNFWNVDDIECFYGSSGGTILTVLILLSDDFKTSKDYIIKRPWNTLWQFEPNVILNIYKKIGLFSIDDFYKAFEPFFNAKNIDRNITLKEFYDMTQKTIYFYIGELNKFEVFYVNYKTHPEMKLIEAIYKSSSVPGIFIPIMEDDKCYIDGGLLNYFPTNDALNNADNETILGLCSKRIPKHSLITPKSNMFDFFITLLFKNMDFVIDSMYHADKIKNIIYVPGFDSNSIWLQTLNSEAKRAEMYDLGIKTAQDFLKEQSKNTENTEDTLIT